MSPDEYPSFRRRAARSLDDLDSAPEVDALVEYLDRARCTRAGRTKR
jgi:hypothetical protein